MREHFEITVYIGAFKSKHVKEDVYLGSRAVIAFNRTNLVSPRTTATPVGVTARGRGITVSLSQDRDSITFAIEIDPVVQSKLLAANRILNSYSHFITPRIKKKAFAFVGFTLTHEVARNRTKLGKYIVPSQLRKLQTSLRLRLSAESLRFTAESAAEQKSIAISHYPGSNDDVDSTIFKGLKDHIPRNIIIKDYKRVHKMLNLALPELLAKQDATARK